MDSFSAVIDAFGYAELAKLLERPEGTVSSWKTRDSIPPEVWQQIVTEAEAKNIKGISLSVLAGLAAKKRAPLLERDGAA